MWTIVKCALVTKQHQSRVIGCSESLEFPDIDRVYGDDDRVVAKVIESIVNQRVRVSIGQRLPELRSALDENETLTLRCELFGRIFLMDVRPDDDPGVDPLYSFVVQDIWQAPA